MTGTCGAIIDFGWRVGALGGLIIDVFLLIAILQASRLREHEGTLPPMGFAERWTPTVPPVLVTILWLWGLSRVGLGLLSCYAAYSAIAAAIMTGLLMLVLFPLAATQIARRSVW